MSQAAAGDTIYGIGNALFEDFPTLCVRLR
jgi:hypothetical protein